MVDLDEQPVARGIEAAGERGAGSELLDEQGAHRRQPDSSPVGAQRDPSPGGFGLCRARQSGDQVALVQGEGLGSLIGVLDGGIWHVVKRDLARPEVR